MKLEHALLLVAFIASFALGIGLYDLFTPKEESKPIESTRRVIWSCTVKSNIEGVITLNDDCKITVIGEE